MRNHRVEIKVVLLSVQRIPFIGIVVEVDSFRLKSSGDADGLFASKPAPTFDRIPPEGTRLNVGAGLLAKGPEQTPPIPR